MRGERGDTLIEVTFALAILGFVLLSSTVIAMTAFRMGQTARERSQIAAEAQEQMEALRSFRDNHSWGEFMVGDNSGMCTGAGGNYCGIDKVLGSPCVFDGATYNCFHMEKKTVGGNTEWVPVPGTVAGSTPTSVMGISSQTTVNSVCGYDFVMHYAFDPLGGGQKARNQIATRLVNLRYDPNGGPIRCP